ncbi:response regulator transcription factor [Kribbella sandramycini]|uniref:DNA-binding NarL/FixJ family response regulator n=1 Tax=Kribbella sandramycini TaxID=60450 RepID=A0A7Y4KW02_9ACTN|nr:response regulator transcription factor [Kribbella sandramycini]MBB6567650.1 DNA-binding NarL/FixJ family response regulator [Kribbella sandramycini]NOL39749.1 response regulator transcription factor [Kribbella sandramycini]
MRVLLVDDHVVVRAGLRALLDGEPGFEVVGETGDGEESIRLALDLRPDLVLMDLRLDNGAIDGIEATRRLAAVAPATKVVVLTSHGTRTDVALALAAGARGYVLKAGPPDELFRALRTANDGGTGMAHQAVELLVDEVTQPTGPISDREIDVLRLLAQGRSNREIALDLFLSEATIKTHLVRIYRKLGAANRAAAVTEATRRGLIPLD